MSRLWQILGAIDLKEKDTWDDLTEEERKDVVFWTLNRWVSSVKGNYEVQSDAVLNTNYFYNKNWNDLGTKHPKLQWQLLCLVNETNKPRNHVWIKLETKANSSDKVVKFLSSLYPDMKIDEVEVLARISTKQEIKQLAKDHGLDPKSINV